MDLQGVEPFFPDEEAEASGGIGVEFVNDHDDFAEETHEGGSSHSCSHGHKWNEKHALEQHLTQVHRCTVHSGSREPGRKGTDQVDVKTGDGNQYENRNDTVP